MRTNKVYIIMLLGIIIGIGISIISSYCLAETLINSKDVYYKDNSGLAVNNVQDAIDGTCTKFSKQIDTFLDKVYPVGSVYISTTLDTPAKVKTALGGTWEVYGKGQTLVGVDTSQNEFKTVNTAGGSKTTSYTPNGTVGNTTLTADQIPSHTHTISHTHTTPATNISSSGAHTHTTTASKITNVSVSTASLTGSIVFHGLSLASDVYQVSGVFSNGYTNSQATAAPTTASARSIGQINFNGNHTHTVSATIPALSIASSGAHTHTVPAMTTNSQSTTTSGATGGGQAHNHTFTGTATTLSTLQPYVTVYMYKRIE